MTSDKGVSEHGYHYDHYHGRAQRLLAVRLGGWVGEG